VASSVLSSNDGVWHYRLALRFVSVSRALGIRPLPKQVFDALGDGLIIFRG
jgi:hypothetical protein